LVAQDKRLGLQEIEELIKLLPDQALAGEIRDRNVKFTVRKNTLTDLAKLGAAAQTIEALRTFLWEGQLMIVTKPRRPDATVTINGAGAYRTGANGAVVVTDVEPGDHTIQVKRPPYKDAEAKVTVVGPRTAVEVPLEPATPLAVVPGQSTSVPEEPDHLGLPASAAGKTYSFSFTAAGGVPPYEWSMPADAIPPGMSLSRGGVLSGMPKKAGAYRFIVQVRDSDASQHSQKMRLIVGPAENGEIVWRGNAQSDSIIILNAGYVTPGTIEGDFPSFPVRMEVQQTGIKAITLPGPENGWKVLVLHIERGPVTRIPIRWFAVRP